VAVEANGSNVSNGSNVLGVRHERARVGEGAGERLLSSLQLR